MHQAKNARDPTQGHDPVPKRAQGHDPTKNQSAHRNWNRDRNTDTYLGAFRGLRPSTMHGCPEDLQRLHVFSPSGKSHFIYGRRRAS